MIPNTEQLRQKAHELALTHDPYLKRWISKSIWPEFNADVEKIRAFIHSLQDENVVCSQPAEEWILDHAEFIEEQVLVIRHQSRSFFRALPKLRKTGQIRVLNVCMEYLEQVDSGFDEETLILFLNSYQEVSVLTIAEVWAIPVILRIALIRRLAECIDLVGERREVCVSVERLLGKIEPSRFNPEVLKGALEEAGKDMPLSGPVVVHLVRHLREWADDSATVREWLICKLENGAESLDQIISYENQLQAAYQATTGNLIGSLRKISRMDWCEPFEKIALVEKTFREECSDIYAKLEFSSRDLLRKRTEELARQIHVPENLVAQTAVELADKEYKKYCKKSDSSIEPARKAFSSYYLLEAEGIKELRKALKSCSSPKDLQDKKVPSLDTGRYFSVLAVSFVIALIGLAWWIGGAKLATAEWAIILITLALPVSEWAIMLTHRIIECSKSPRPLLRYDFSQGIPSDATTMVVIPVIWSTVKEVQELVDRLELHYLANRDDNIHFALLADFVDAAEEKLADDEVILAAARSNIEELNKTYSRPGGSTFHLFQRSRQWNPSEGVWMGWERKRGILVEFVELLKGKKDTSFCYVVGDTSILSSVRYIITLDADTKLPIGSAQRMIGTIHLPYNRPRLNNTKTRVIEGYGILQPRVSISHGSALSSRFAYLWSMDPGIDPYAFAVSDPYQDVFAQGIFTGKGIFDVDTFAEVLCERIPENRVLSHDLLEGGFLRTGLLSDIELLDEHPSTYRSYQKRLHRWVRGDWQLLLWFKGHAPNRRGTPLKVDLSALTRWQMIDNLRRSLLVPVQFLILLGVTFLPGSAKHWLTFVLLTLFLPIIRQLMAITKTIWRPRNLLGTAGQVGLTIVTLPFQSALLLDAIIRTLYRLLITKRNLLTWVSSAEIDRRSRGGKSPALECLYSGYVLILLFGLTVVSSTVPVIRSTGLSLVLLWAIAPQVIRWMDQPLRRPEQTIGTAEQEELKKLAQEIWTFYEDYVTEEDNWLPPDNVQMDPPNGIAHRTSPTNIGLYMTCALAARDFGFIDTPGLIERLERTVSTVERLEKWKGHIYNWYDTVTLNPLPPKYVSTVDSGNLVGCLITVKEGLAEWLTSDNDLLKRTEAIRKPRNTSEGLAVAFAEELAPVYGKNYAKSAESEWLVQGQNLIKRIEALINETDFRPLYNHKFKLFSLGYHAGLNQTDDILYDLMASEARQSSFVAIALGQVSVSHWHSLGRTMTKVGKKVTLLSWSGTMFEYLMPWLFMRTYRNTIWDSTYQAVVKRQIEYAHQRGVPFGISESGYYAFDFQMNYQYRAFGVPGLGFKRGLEQDLVVAPYATILALPFAREQGLEDLRKIEKLGGRGKYGYYEALDFTKERLQQGKTCQVIRSFMAHHQGMSLLALANLLSDKKIYERFHRDKRIKAAELLLQERIPARAKIIKHPALARVYVANKSAGVISTTREYLTADTSTPEVCVLSNGTFMTMVSNNGSGFSRYEGLAVTRWREDPVLDNWGNYIYIRDVTGDAVWSPTFQPCRVPASKQRIQFSPDRATFMREDPDMKTSLEICVSPEWNAEVRRLTLTNTSGEERVIEVTTFMELSLTSPIADDAHPAFSKLFIRTEYVENNQCLLASRRPRQGNEKPIWAAHSLMVMGKGIGVPEYESDRSSFIGRGRSLAGPEGIRSNLRGRVGSVADPAFIMRRRVSIPPGQQVQMVAVTSVAETKEEALEIIGRFSGELLVERTFQLAWNRSQIELRHLHITAAESMAFQAFAGQVLYTPPLRPDRKDYIAANVKGQSGLWAYGVSGDLPIIAVRIENQVNIKFVVKVLTAHEYLRRLGLMFDLVLLNESPGGYQQDLQEALRRTVESVHPHHSGPGNVVIVNSNQLPEEDKILLLATARMVLKADGPSLRAQTRLPKQDVELPPELIAKASINRFGKSAQVAVPELMFYNSWGGFSASGREYQIIIKNGNQLPAPWVNVIANPYFGCLVSELGTGYTWWRNSREFKITPWSNDPVLDPAGEVCYLRDEDSGEFWSTTPISHSGQLYKVTHGRGFTRFQHDRCGLSQEMTLFVPEDEPIKVIKLKLHNHSVEKRHLSVTYYTEWVLGVRRQPNAPFIITEWDSAAEILVARNVYQETFQDGTVFVGVYPQCGSFDGEHQLSWTADRSEFLGRNGLVEKPAALGRKYLSGKVGAVYDACGAVQAKLVLEPGAEQTVYILLGCENSRAAAVKLAEKYRQPSVCDQALQRVKEFWNSILDQISVKTPSKEFDTLVNGWLLYQALGCRIWARTAFYQAGGAYGFRDQLQDALALLHSKPDITRAQILLHAAHQYKEGDVQHWWHEETERGIRTHFSDDLLWLPYAVGRYVEHTGDDSILEEVVPFLDSEPLQEGEHERYEPTKISEQSATIYEHCLRAIDLSLQRFGEHKLPLMGIGDWNDGMNLVGEEGRGESVWLGWFIIEVLKYFKEISTIKGEVERVKLYKDIQEQLVASLNEHAWDGQWYRRAFTDAGQWLGSIQNEECRIDAIAQSWSVISGAALPEQAQRAMQSFDRELVDRDLSVVRLLTPPFDHTEPSPGYIQGYPPGIRENGAQYTHGIIWSIVAWSILGNGDKAFKVFDMINPINHTRTHNEVRQYYGEPYVMAADVYTADPHKGRAGWTWYTGAAGWMYQAAVEWILGIKRRGNRLLIQPCIPHEWTGFRVSYRFGSSTYHIEVKNPSFKSGGLTALELDGQKVELVGENVKEMAQVALCDDGKVHQIVVTL